MLELSPDWLILRASENAHRFLGEYPVTLIGEPLASFRWPSLSTTCATACRGRAAATGSRRAYRMRLTDEPRHFDIAFQLVDGTLLLEGLPSADGFGEAFGAVSRLIDGMAGDRGRRLLESAARRIRALTGFDRVTFLFGDAPSAAESSRGNFPRRRARYRLPAIVADTMSVPVRFFPAANRRKHVGRALLRGLSGQSMTSCRRSVFAPSCGSASPQGGEMGRVRCDSQMVRRRAGAHAATELFAQIFAMRLERPAPTSREHVPDAAEEALRRRAFVAGFGRAEFLEDLLLLALIRVGVSTRIRATRSPRPRPLRTLMPEPRWRSCSPDWTPGGS